jgi:hypothetical protein
MDVKDSRGQGFRDSSNKVIRHNFSFSNPLCLLLFYALFFSLEPSNLEASLREESLRPGIPACRQAGSNSIYHLRLICHLDFIEINVINKNTKKGKKNTGENTMKCKD